MHLFDEGGDIAGLNGVVAEEGRNDVGRHLHECCVRWLIGHGEDPFDRPDPIAG